MLKQDFSETGRMGLAPAHSTDHIVSFATVHLGVATCQCGVSALFLAVTRLLSTVILYLGCLQGSRLLHSLMLGNILRTALYFFDTTPIGRILNRFSKDVDTVDNVLPQNLGSVLTCFCVVMA